MLVLQKGFNYSQDGPGNRLVYHLQGCNFACKWCSNADSIPRENPKAKERSGDDIFDEIMRSRMMFFDGGGVTFTGGECTLWHAELLPLFKRSADPLDMLLVVKMLEVDYQVIDILRKLGQMNA